MRLRHLLTIAASAAAIAIFPATASAQDTDPGPPTDGIAAATSTVELLVSTGELNDGQANALLGKLEQIEAYLAAGDVKRAAHAVAAFSNQVRAHVRAGHFASLLGDGLIAAAEAALP